MLLYIVATPLLFIDGLLRKFTKSLKAFAKQKRK